MKRAAPPDDPSSSSDDEGEQQRREGPAMHRGAAFRSLSVGSSPTVPLVHRAAGAPFEAKPATPEPRSLASPHAAAQSLPHRVSVRDLLKRVLRGKFDAQYLPVQQTAERWSSWIDERWSELTVTEQGVFHSEVERINAAACSAQRRAARAPARPPAPALFAPAAGL